MYPLDRVKAQVKRLYETNPQIHLNVSLSRPRLSLQNTQAVIKGVYAHIFTIEETESGFPQCHTLQYADLLTGHIVILELEKRSDPQ